MQILSQIFIVTLLLTYPLMASCCCCSVIDIEESQDEIAFAYRSSVKLNAEIFKIAKKNYVYDDLEDVPLTPVEESKKSFIKRLFQNILKIFD